MAVCWPIIILGDVADNLGLAHCTGRSCFRWFRIGLLFFREMLPINQDGPFAAAEAAFDGSMSAHYFSGRCCRCIGWAHCSGSSSFQQRRIGLLFFLEMLLIN